MEWYEVTAHTNRNDADMVASVFIDHGCTGIIVDDPDEIREYIQHALPYDNSVEDVSAILPKEHAVRGYFHITHDVKTTVLSMQKAINHLCKGTNRNRITKKRVNDEHWQDWKKYFTAFEMIPSVVIVPSWEEYDALYGQKIIYMDPGMAFGTGTHETTVLCAKYTQKYAQGTDHMLDLGTGSGILSIVGAYFGAKSITAVDIDEAAVAAAKQNLQKNHIHHIRVIQGTIDCVIHKKFDLIVSNIIADILIEIAEKIKTVATAQAKLVLSGIIQKKEQDVIDAYVKHGFRFIEASYQKDWTAIVLQCQDSI